MLNQHAKRGAPVADVIFANNTVSNKLQHAHQRITNHRAAQMPNVHFFCHVWRRIVDHHFFRGWRITHTKSRIGCRSSKLARQKLACKCDVDKPWPGYLGCAAHIRQIGGIQYHLRNFTRCFSQYFCQCKRPVYLGICPIASAHHRVAICAARNVGKRRSQQLCNSEDRVSHSPSIVADRTPLRAPYFIQTPARVGHTGRDLSCHQNELGRH